MKVKKLLVTLLIFTFILNYFCFSNVEAAKQKIPTNKNYTFKGLERNVTVKATYNKGKYYVPVIYTYEKLGAEIISEDDNVDLSNENKIIAQYGLSKIKLYSNGKVVVDNIKQTTFNNVTTKLKGKLYISADSFSKILKLINLPIETDISKVKYLDNGLPLSDYDYNINIIHKENIPYWEWDSLDNKYLSKLQNKLSKSNKEVIIQEIFKLDQYKRLWETQYTTVNNFNYYPSTTAGIIDTLYRAIIARENLIRSDFSYPNIGSICNIGKEEVYKLTNKTNYKKFIEDDIKNIKLLKEIPFDTSAYKNFKIINLPFKYKGHGGFVSGYITYLMYNCGNIVFYHELGHVWHNLYLIQNFEEYIKLREQNTIITTGPWRELTRENFADDFNVTMSPYADKFYHASYGYPSDAIIQKMKDFITSKEKNKCIDKTIKINNKYILGDIFTTTNNSIEISGKEDSPFEITIVNPNFEEETITINPTDNIYSNVIKFNEEGLYSIYRLFGGTLKIYYYKDMLSKKLTLSEENDNNLSWEQLKTQDLSDTMKNWLYLHADYNGYWVKELSDYLFVSISEGFEYGEIRKCLKVVDIKFNDNETIIEVAPGNEKDLLLRLPLSVKDKPIIVKGLQNSHLSDNDQNNFILDDLSYYELLKGQDLCINVTARVKNTNKKLYYEIVSDNKIIYSKNVNLDCSELHWTALNDMYIIKSSDIKDRVDFIFYTDETKKVELGRTYIIAQ